MGCSTTGTFVKGLALDPDHTVEEKFISFGAVPIKMAEPEKYFDGRAWLERMTELIDKADDYIFLSTFLGSNCEDLYPVYDALANASRRGVDVYMVIDGISSYDMTESKNFLEPVYPLKDSGVHLVEYAPLSFTRAIAPWSLIVRDHRKMMVVDGKIGIIGGMNVNYISMGSKDEKTLQRDSMYVFNSYDLVANMAKEFVSLWNASSVETIKLSDFATYSYDNYEGQDLTGYLFNQGPGGKAHMADVYSTLFNSAKEEIIILPYLPLLDDNMLTCLKNAVDRGIKVKMLFPLDQRGYSEKGTKYFFINLVEAGIECYFIPTNEISLLHEKLTVVDNKYVVIGSANFNMRSMNLSHEIVMAIDNEEFAQKMKEHIQNDRMFYAQMLDLETAQKWKREDGSLLMYLASYYGG